MTEPVRDRLVLSGILLVLGAGWGLSVPLSRIAVSTGHLPFGLLFWQLLIGSVLLGGLLATRRRPFPLGWATLRVFVVIACLGTILPNSFSYRATAHLPAGIMAIIIATVPMFAFPVALALGQDRFALRRLVGLCLGLLGVGLIAAPEASLPDPAMLAWIPVALIAPLCYGLEGNVVARWGLSGLDPVQALFGASVLGAIVMAPAALATGQFIDPRAGMGAPEWALVASALIHASVYAAYVWLVGRAGPVFAGQVAYVVTGFGVLWSMILLSETYAIWVWAALGVMLCGIALVQPRPRETLAPEAEAVDSQVNAATEAR